MLTQEQIQYLHQFCTKHYVRFYDLQLELVDHLANAIEQKMDENPKLNFEQALDEVYKGFGIFGFSRIVSERDLALRKKYQKSFWKYFLSYFTPPRLALTFLIFLALNVPIYFFQKQYIHSFFIAYTIIGGVFGLAGLVIALKKFKKPKKKLLLLQSSGGVFGIFAFILQLPNFYFNLFLQGENGYQMQFSNIHKLLVTGVFTLIFLSSIAYFDTYRNLYYQAKSDYPLAWEQE